MNTISYISSSGLLNSLHAGMLDSTQIPDLPIDHRVLPPISTHASVTFQHAAERYYSEVVELERVPRGQQHVRSMLRSRLYPAFADRLLHTITRGEIRELIRDIGENRKLVYGNRVDGCRGRANSIYWFLRGLFAWACNEEEGNLLMWSPMQGIKQPYRYMERTRVLNDDEIRRFWIACREIGYPFGTIGRLLLLTGQRRSEIANMHAWQIDRSSRLLSIPINKSRRAHVVPLSTLALELLEAVPQGDPRALVFPGYKGRVINGCKLEAVNEVLRARVLGLQREDLIRAGGDPANAFVEHWTYHDLRRTLATQLVRLGHGVETIDKILNHGPAGGGVGRTVNAVTRIYCRDEILDARREALQDFGEHVRRLVLA